MSFDALNHAWKKDVVWLFCPTINYACGIGCGATSARFNFQVGRELHQLHLVVADESKSKEYAKHIQSLKKKKIVFDGFDDEEIHWISVDTVNFLSQVSQWMEGNGLNTYMLFLTV